MNAEPSLFQSGFQTAANIFDLIYKGVGQHRALSISLEDRSHHFSTFGRGLLDL